jgi:simple sugar transport system ATP-binding protein
MDEPTAALGVAESRQVLDLIRALQRGGTTVILISHNMADIVAVASRVAVLKNGSKIAELPVAGLDADDLAHLVMTGQRLRAA